MAKISVIIPVYGVEKYLDRCVESVVNQTYKDLEIILVDDGSPDNCPRMCDEWAKRDARIQTIHRENGGQSCARNTGLSVATGDYITFVDSDDWIAEDYFGYSLRLMEEYSADVVQIGFKKVYSQEEKVNNPAECIMVYTNKEILENYMRQSTIDGSYSVWRCIFSSYAIRPYRFREGKINEDIDFKYKVLSGCKKIVNSNLCKYYYFQQGSSSSTGGLKQKDFDLYDAATELDKLTLNEKYGKIRFYSVVKSARTPFSLLCKIAYFGVADKEIDAELTIARLVNEHRKCYHVLLKAPLPVSRKVLAVMFAINYSITEKIIRILKHFCKY